MKHLTRHMIIWLFLFYGTNVFASHVLGGEIYYKHIKNNEYKVTLNIYRDCNGCKINGNGGGSSSENCSEIDYIFVKGIDNTTSKETKFQLTRENIVDITPLCRSKISTCNSGSNSNFGIELQQFTTVINLDDSKIKGFCNYYIYLTLSERNGNITTGQAKQNFCIDAYVNACAASKNNSALFVSQPTFTVNSNKTQYPSFFAFDSDKDSLVYSLTPALSAIDKNTTYNTGFNHNYPLTVYCTEMPPCSADKTKETGFYFDKTNGSALFIPTNESEIGVLAVKVEEYRKISGNWELVGYIKRDLQVYIKTSDGNNSPKFLNKDYFEICEEEPLSLKIETSDDKNSSTMVFDSVSYTLNSVLNGSSFVQYAQVAAPYNYGIFKWTPPLGASSNGIYTLSVSATDNFCPLKSVSTQIISIKVKPKESLTITYKELGCGNFLIKSSAFNNQSKLIIKLFAENNLVQEVFSTTSVIDTVSYLPEGKYFVKASLLSDNGCETLVTDSILNFAKKTNTFLLGENNPCKETEYTYSLDNSSEPKFNVKWSYNSMHVGNGSSFNYTFKKDGNLNAFLSYKKGKWQCYDTLAKEIVIVKLPEIINSSILATCQNTGTYDLKNISILPSNGEWTSKNTAFHNNKINTYIGAGSFTDTLILNYKIVESGCSTSKNFNFVILAVPEFNLNNIAICEVATPVFFDHQINKPYNKTDYQYTWQLPLFNDKIKDLGGFKAFNPSEIGFGTYTYCGEVISKNGCKNYDTALIDITPAVKIKFENGINICEQSGLIDISKLSGASPDNGNWSFVDFGLISNRRYASTDTCGQFEVTYVYDNYGCYDSKKITISIECKPEIKINIQKNSICDSELPLYLNASPLGGFWSGNFISGTSFSPPLINQTKEYQYSYVLNNGNCTFKENSRITVHPSPVINLTPDKFIYCNTEPLTLSGAVSNSDKLIVKHNSETIEKSIDNKETIINFKTFDTKFDKNSVTKPLSVLCTNNQGCESSRDFLIRTYDRPIVAKFNDTVICEGSDLIIYPLVNYNGKEPLSYTWTENFATLENTKNLMTGKLTTGFHSISFRTDNGYCSDSQTFKLGVNPKPMVDFIIQPSNTTTITQPNFWFRNQSGLNLSWLWDFGTNRDDNFSIEQHPKYSYQDTGIYNVSLTGVNIFGCSTTLYKTVVVRPDLLIFIPNAFSPNGKDEEKNNMYSISLQNYNSYSIEIYDRWGHKVFYSDDPKDAWDGKLGGVLCTPGVYFYSIKINSITNHSYLYRGTITLIK